MKKIILLVCSLIQFFTLFCPKGHWLFPDGDRPTQKERKTVDCFTYSDVRGTLACTICCNNLPTMDPGVSTKSILAILRAHLEQEHPEEIDEINKKCSKNPSGLAKKPQSVKLTKQ